MEGHDLYEMLGVPPGTGLERIQEICHQRIGDATPDSVRRLPLAERVGRGLELVELTAAAEVFADAEGRTSHDRLHQEIRRKQEELQKLEQQDPKKRKGKKEQQASSKQDPQQAMDILRSDLTDLEGHRSRLHFLRIRLTAARLLGLRGSDDLATRVAEGLDERWTRDHGGEVMAERWRELRRRLREWGDVPLPGLETRSAEPVEATPPARPDTEDLPKDLRPLLAGAAVARGDAWLMERVLESRGIPPTRGWLPFLAGEEPVDPRRLDDEEGRTDLRWETVLRALDRVRYQDASRGSTALGCRDDLAALIFDEAAEALASGREDAAARLLVRAADLESPVGPRHEASGLQLHFGCPREEGGCLTDEPLEVIRLQGLGYLLGSRTWAGRLSAVPADRRASLLRALARLRDPDLDGFLERYARQVARYLEIQDLTGGARREALEPLGAELLGRELPYQRFDMYLRALAREHPLAPLGLCMEALGNELLLIPKARDGVGLLQLVLATEAVRQEEHGD